MICAFSDNKPFSECAGSIVWDANYKASLCGFHRDMLNEVEEVSKRKGIDFKPRYTIIREGPIFTPGQMVKIGLFDEEHNEYSVLGELHYAAAKEIVEKLNKE